MASMRTDIISRENQDSIKNLDKGVKNQWRWEWLEKEVDGTYLRDTIRKLKASGMAYCLTCHRELSYGSRGLVALLDHVKAVKHRRKLNVQRTNFALPGAGDCQKEVINAQYGLHPMFKAVTSGAKPSRQTHTPVIDRVVNNEALLLTFLAEKSLPFSLVPDLLDIIKYFSHDKIALNQMSMSRTAASYKLRFGIAKTFESNLIEDLKNSFFSFNIDESTSANNSRVVTLLVNYVTKELKIVTKHLSSFTLNVVNSEYIFKEVEKIVKEKGLEWGNLMSVLLDSCNIMRGRKAGLEKRIRDMCPTLLDIDGDSCHHAHNAAKAFCKPFNMHIEKLAIDIHNDFKWSPDLRAVLSKICDVLNIKYTVPENFISFRWLSAYDVAVDICRLFDGLILFYFSFLRSSEKTTYLHVMVRIFRSYKLNEAGKDQIRGLQSVLSTKILTDAGKERKNRIKEKLICNQIKTKLFLGFYISILPMLKEYIKLFENSNPLIHQLHVKQKELLLVFLGCFIKPEVLNNLKQLSKKIKYLDVSNISNHLSFSSMFVGHVAKQIIHQASKGQIQVIDQFKKVAIEAFISCAKYLQRKMPICNPFLITVTAIDPLVRSKSETLKRLKNIPLYVKNVINDKDVEEYEKEVHLYVNDQTIKYIREEKITEWWKRVEASGKYRLLCKVVFSLLTCFHGPKVESSFSIMNNIITPGTSNLNVSTFSAIQTIKYELLCQNKTSLQLFGKEDFMYEPVDKHLCKNVRNSAKLYKEEQMKNQALKEEKRKELQIKKEKLLTKKAAKKAFGDAAKRQRHKHLHKNFSTFNSAVQMTKKLNDCSDTTKKENKGLSKLSCELNSAVEKSDSTLENLQPMVEISKESSDIKSSGKRKVDLSCELQPKTKKIKSAKKKHSCSSNQTITTMFQKIIQKKQI